MTKQLQLWLAGGAIALLISYTAQAQCSNYSVYNVPAAQLPDNCTNAIDAGSYYGSCQTICIDNTTATGSNTTPDCAPATAHDIWTSIQDAYSTIPGFDGSLVLAWKKYPTFPVNQPTMATHLDLQGTLYIGIFPTNVSTDCSDGFLAPNIICSNYQDTNRDNTVVLQPGTFPTNAQIEQGIEDSPDLPVTAATVTSSKIWFQIETFDNVPGLICFELSKKVTGFTCGEPNTVSFSGVGTTQTQNVSDCLCNSAANSGYFSQTNQPCTPPSNGINIGTTAYYQINAPYACNQISVKINSWAGSGNLNVAILRDMVCPTVPDSSTVPPTQYPGWVVDSADELAVDCLNASLNNNTVSTLLSNCLPAGTYYVLISGNTDKDTFGAGITVSDNTPTGVVVQARAFLEGCYAGGGFMNTTLRLNGYLPLAQPYNRVPWLHNGGEAVANAAAMPTNAVDWVLLEVRDATTEALIETRAALLLDNGAIVDADGITNGVRFQNISNGSSYKLALRHRNHLAVMGSTAVAMPNATPYDFANTTQVVQGSTQLKNVGGGINALFAGDTNAEGIINRTDYNKYVLQTGNTNPYLDSDCNLDGTVNSADFTTLRPNLQLCNVEQVRY